MKDILPSDEAEFERYKDILMRTFEVSYMASGLDAFGLGTNSLYLLTPSFRLFSSGIQCQTTVSTRFVLFTTHDTAGCIPIHE